MRTAIVLAAGEATRLPNKILLPIPDRKIAIESSILFARGSYCDEIIIVHNGEELLPKILKARGHGNNLKYVSQLRPDGVCAAIARGANSATLSEAVILFADNIYPHWEVAQWDKHPIASVRGVTGDLDGWDGSRWLHRQGALKLAGWVTLPTAVAKLAEGPFVDFLNGISCEPLLRKAENWHDIGTLDSYTKVWTNELGNP